MATMKVDGREPLEVPAHLDGVVAAGNGQRILYRIVDAGIFTVFWGMYVFLPIAMIRMIPYAYTNLAFFLLMLAYSIGVLAMVVKRGQTPGMALCHARWVRFDTGAPAGKAGLGKYALEGAISSATLGIAPLIIWLASQDDANRHWFSRTCGTITLNLRTGRDPQFEGSAEPVASDRKLDSAPPRPWEAAKSLDTAGGKPLAPPPPPPPPQPPVQPAYGLPAVVSNPGSLPVPPMSNPLAPQMPAPPAPVAAPNADAGRFIGEVPWASAIGGPIPPMPPSPLPQSLPPSPLPQSLPPPPLPQSLPPSPLPVFTATTADDVLDHTIARQTAGTVLLRFDSGSEHVLVGAVVVGRDPVADAAHPEATGLPLTDPDRSISKTHLALTSQDGGVWVEDLHSTNGTQVESPTGVLTPVLPDDGVLATNGSVIHFGDRWVTVSAQ